MDEMDGYRAQIKEDICYDLLLQERPYDRERIDGYVELMVDICCSTRPCIRIGGQVRLQQERLRQDIDRVLPGSASFGDFLERMRAEGYEVEQGRYLSFRAPGQERPTRSHRLGDGCTLEALRARANDRRGPARGTRQRPRRTDGRSFGLLAKKQAEYEKYKALRQEMITIRTAKQNVDQILGLEQELVNRTGIDR